MIRLLPLLLLLAGCMAWDDDGSSLPISPPASDLDDDQTSAQSWQGLWVLNNNTFDAVCDVRVQTDVDRVPSTADAPQRRIDLPGGATTSGGDLCVFCEEGEAGCQPVGLYTCFEQDTPRVLREWMWWVQCD